VSLLEREAPPVGEEIHLPGPTIQPVLLTLGITVALIGLTTTPILLIAGAVLAVVVIVRWVREVVYDVNQLPAEHRH
jgi:hypothetical protein